MASFSLLALMAMQQGATAQQAQPLVAQVPPTGAAPTSLDEISVTATRQEERAIDSLAAVSVTTREDIREQQPQRIGTILNQVPGVSTQENPNDPATAINIRGLQDFGRVAVLVDGARQNFQRSGHNADGAFFLDPSFIRTIDITRGPVSNIYGSGAIGGVVAFETVYPTDILRPGERIAAEVAGTGVVGRQTGGYGSVIGAVRPTDFAEGLVGLSFRKLNPYSDGAGFKVDDSGQDLRSGLGKIVLTPGYGQELALSGQYQKYDFSNGIGSSQSPRRANEVTTDNFVARYTFSRPENPWLNLHVAAYSTSTDTEQTRISGRAREIGNDRFFRIRTTGTDVYNTTNFDLGAAQLALTYGGDFFQDRVRTFDAFSSGDEFTPSGKRTVYGAFTQAHMRWMIFDAIAGARYDGYELSGGTHESDGQRVSPKFTLGVTPIPGIQVYGTYAEGYRAPAITETLIDGLHPPPFSFVFVPNPNLRPEVGHNVEAGVNLKYNDVAQIGDRFRGKVSVFQNDVSDFIEGVFSPFPFPFGQFTYVNVANARLTGVEAEFVYDTGAWFATLAGSSIRGDNLDTDEPLESVYPDKLALGGGVRLLNERLLLSGRVTFVADQNRLPPNASVLASKAYTLVDLNASYAITPDARAFLSLENVGDIRYRRYRDNDFSPGFTAKIGFATRFGT